MSPYLPNYLQKVHICTVTSKINPFTHLHNRYQNGHPNSPHFQKNYIFLQGYFTISSLYCSKSIKKSFTEQTGKELTLYETKSSNKKHRKNRHTKGYIYPFVYLVSYGAW